MGELKVIAKTTQQRDSQPRRSAVSHAVNTHIQSRRNQYLAAAVVSGALAMPQESLAQQAGEVQGAVLEEIIVTAQKREESLQDVPISVTALTSTRLKELGIGSFEDYALMLPSVSYFHIGPGTATIYMRGASDGGDGNQSGSQPSIGLYLDEAPVTSIATNLDIHIYDMARIEALGGPQGTLFGASSQSGNLRIITNKPDPSEFSGGLDLGAFGTDGGDESYSVEGFVNVPLGENAAIRLVAWNIEEGGYIDNVPGTITYTLDFRAPGASVCSTCAPGVSGYGYNTAGSSPYRDPSFPPFNATSFGRTTAIDNADRVEDNFNDLTKRGLRAALRINLSDTWVADASVIYQDQETEGTWDHDPSNVGELNIQRYNEDSGDDEFVQFGLTLDGEIGNHRLVYSGSFMDRDVEYHADYVNYGVQGYWVPYYICDYSASGPDLATQSNTDCTSLEEFYIQNENFERDTHEIRLESQSDGPLNYTLGGYFNEVTHDYLLEWHQPGISPNQVVPGAFTLDTGDVFFRTDQERTDQQIAIFGNVTYDLTDSVSVSGGFRYFENETTVRGTVGWGTAIFGDRDVPVDLKRKDDDVIFKANLTWRIDDERMVYFTWSEGYRPGGINRDPALADVGAQEWEPDFLTNYEVGLKSTWLDQRVRLNGAVYFSDWENVQFTIFDFFFSSCCGNVFNLNDSEILGVEADGTFLITDNWTLFAAFSYSDGETSGPFVLPDDDLSLAVPKGTDLPNVPKFKGNVSTRHQFGLGNLNAFAQLTYAYTGSRWNELTSGRVEMDSYSILNFRAGIDQGKWGVDVFANNLTNEVAEIIIAPRNSYEIGITTNRPLSYGAKYWVRF